MNIKDEFNKWKKERYGTHPEGFATVRIEGAESFMKHLRSVVKNE